MNRIANRDKGAQIRDRQVSIDRIIFSIHLASLNESFNAFIHSYPVI